jgi:hypothetical protein
MKNDYGFDTLNNKLKVSAGILRMEFQRGEGELGIENQGRFGSHNSKVFSQETVAIGQQTPRIGGERPKLGVLGAGSANDSDSTPLFSFFPRIKIDMEICRPWNRGLCPRAPAADGHPGRQLEVSRRAPDSQDGQAQ